MPEVIEFHQFSNRPVKATTGDLSCWLCQRGVSERALFCHNCGTVQQVRDIDHFARLGVERRIDPDMELLRKQYETLKRSLEPSRFAIRGIGEKGHAERQVEALDNAYETLRDPLKRGRYWLSLNFSEVDRSEPSNPMIADLVRELEDAIVPPDCDRIAQKAGQAMENGIMTLMQSLRGQNWQQANATLLELDELEDILSSVRDRRLELLGKWFGLEVEDLPA